MDDGGKVVLALVEVEEMNAPATPTLKRVLGMVNSNDKIFLLQFIYKEI